MFICGSLYAQEDVKLDTLTTDIIQKLYKDSLSSSQTDSTKGSSSFNAYPYVYYTPETQLAAGAGGIFIFYSGKGASLKPSKIGFGGFYSSNKQYKLSTSPEFYFANNDVYFKLPTSYGFFINKYWGIGDNTDAYENASYSVKTFASTLTFQVPPEWFFADRTGLILDYDYTEIVNTMDNELLEDTTLIGYNGGHLFGIGSDLQWDSRDNIFYPRSGGFQYFKAVFYPGMSAYVYANMELEVKHFRSIGKGVLAGDFYLNSVMGDAPFYKLPSLGGKQMRGYFFGRYRDNFYLMSQLEYRRYFTKRWGFVLFGTLGNVSDNIISYDFSSLKYSFGGGLRFMFNEKENVNLRVDFGVGTDGNKGIYFGIQEAF